MTKSLLSASLLFLLCGPALADTSTNYQIDIAMTKDAQQKYQVLLVDHTCGDMQVKQPKREAYFKVCAKPVDAGHVTLEIERKTRDGAEEINSHAVITMAPKSSFTLLDMKVSLQ